MENMTEMSVSWSETKAKLKLKFATLTDSDMLFMEGKKEEMLARLQAKLGKTKDEIQKVIHGL